MRNEDKESGVRHKQSNVSMADRPEVHDDVELLQQYKPCLGSGVELFHVGRGYDGLQQHLVVLRRVDLG